MTEAPKDPPTTDTLAEWLAEPFDPDKLLPWEKMVKAGALEGEGKPLRPQVLEGENAIAKNREVMGATNPADAAAGTVRAEFAESVGENSVHGSDAPETAAVEIAYFFSGLELVG